MVPRGVHQWSSFVKTEGDVPTAGGMGEIPSPALKCRFTTEGESYELVVADGTPELFINYTSLSPQNLIFYYITLLPLLEIHAY